MDRIQMAKSNMEKFFGRGAAPLEKTDPEFAAIRDRLIYGQIASRGTLGDSLRMLVTLCRPSPRRVRRPSCGSGFPRLGR